MLFEKNISTRTPFSLDMIAILSIIIFITAYLTYGICVIYGVLEINSGEDKTTILDLVNGLAQIATALAFLLAVHQYRKNGEKERQMTISAEAKSLVGKMAVRSDDFAENSKFTENDINRFVNNMSNLGTDFNALYYALTDDLHKAMVRMHWQNMHYNHLSIALKNITAEALFDNCNLDKEDKRYSFLQARLDINITTKPQALREYYFTKNIFEKMAVCNELVNSFDCLNLFENYFFDREATNDVMFGLLSQLDMKISAPLLAVIHERKKQACS